MQAVPHNGHAYPEPPKTTRQEKDARAFGKLPNAIARDASISAAALVVFGYRLAHAGVWVLSQRDVRNIVRCGLRDARVFWRVLRELKSAGLVRRNIVPVKGKQGPGSVENDEVVVAHCGRNYRRVERRWFDGQLSLNALALLLFIRASTQCQSWRVARRFKWSRPTVRAAAAELISVGIIENRGSPQGPVYAEVGCKNPHYKNPHYKKAQSKKTHPLHSVQPPHTVSPLRSVQPSHGAARDPIFEKTSGTDAANVTLTPNEQLRHKADSGAESPMGAGGQHRFSPATIATLKRMGCDVSALMERLIARTSKLSAPIRDPDAYILRMGEEEIAKQTGLTAEQIKALASPSRFVRTAAFAEATRASFSLPSRECLERAQRTRAAVQIEAAVQAMNGLNFTTQRAADRAFHGYLDGIALRQREVPSVHAAAAAA